MATWDQEIVFAVVTDRTVPYDGRTIKRTDIVAGPFDTLEEARAACAPWCRVVRIELEPGTYGDGAS